MKTELVHAKWFVQSPLTLTVATVLLLLTLLMQAGSPRWHYYLSPDVIIYTKQVQEFLAHRSWEPVRSEYQPGALVFFLLPLALAPLGVWYAAGFLLLNALLIAAHITFLRLLGGVTAAGLAVLLFLAAGPITLFRFEAFVSLLALGAFWSWWKQKPLASGALLGLATGVKVYPLFLFPILLRSRVDSRRGGFAARFLAGFGLGLGALLLPFVALGGSLHHVADGLQYHLQKSVAVQSVAGTAATIVGLIRGHLPVAVNNYGMHGFLFPTVRSLSTLGLLLALITLYWRVWFRRITDRTTGAVLLAHAIVTSLLVWPTTFQPQYLLWPLAFTALLPLTGIRTSRWIPIVFAHAAALATTQVTFPLFYSEFLDIFYRGAHAPFLLTMSIASAAFLLLLYVLVCREVVASRVEKQAPGRDEGLW